MISLEKLPEIYKNFITILTAMVRKDMSEGIFVVKS